MSTFTKIRSAVSEELKHRQNCAFWQLLTTVTSCFILTITIFYIFLNLFGGMQEKSMKAQNVPAHKTIKSQCRKPLIIVIEIGMDASSNRTLSHIFNRLKVKNLEAGPTYSLEAVITRLFQVTAISSMPKNTWLKQTNSISIWSLKLHKSAIGICQKGYPEFRVLRCFSNESDSKASVLVSVMVDIH